MASPPKSDDLHRHVNSVPFVHVQRPSLDLPRTPELAHTASRDGDNLSLDTTQEGSQQDRASSPAQSRRSPARPQSQRKEYRPTTIRLKRLSSNTVPSASRASPRRREAGTSPNANRPPSVNSDRSGPSDTGRPGSRNGRDTRGLAVVNERPSIDIAADLRPTALSPAGGSQTALQTANTNSPSRPPRTKRRGRSSLGLSPDRFVSAPPVIRSGSREASEEYQARAVDLLDVVDPEVSTLTTLTNVQNSLFVPNLGRFLNRRPTYEVTPRQDSASSSDTANTEDSSDDEDGGLPAIESQPTEEEGEKRADGTEGELYPSTSSKRRRFSISSKLDKEHYAVLPHLFSVDEWEEQDVQELNDHVRHQLHSRRAKFKRGMKGFKKYISKPLGFLVTLYAFLITIFGLIWVLFIIGWISGGEKHKYDQNVVDNVLVALFAIVGDGLAPFRVVDTYHMAFIAHYHHLTWRLRREQGIPALPNENDLPERVVGAAEDDKEDGAGKEEGKSKKKPAEHNVPSGGIKGFLHLNHQGNKDETKANGAEEEADEDVEPAYPPNKDHFSVLTPKQQRRLAHHTAKFTASHSFYKPHETATHHAFPLRFLVAAVVLLDCHSIFQIMLGSFTWGWSYHTRPGWITAVILSFSITVNITAGIVISIGDKRTRKKEVIEQMYRQALTEEEIKKLRKQKRREQRQRLKESVNHVAIGRNL